MKYRDWMIFQTLPHSWLFTCLRCGLRSEVKLPIPMNMGIAVMKSFQKDHGDCKQLQAK